MSANEQNHDEISSASSRSSNANTSTTTDRSETEDQVLEVDAAHADESDSWETDDEGDFYTEESNERLSDPDDDENLLGLGLSRHLIECYPTTTAEEVSLVGVVCDICLNEYKTNDKLRTIPCLHRFHTRCIDKWLKRSVKCPMCRSDLRKSKWYSS